MKLLYTLIILFAFSFATTYSIEYTRKGLFGSEKLIIVNNAQFKRLVGTHLIFSNSTSLIGDNLIDVNCKNLISITDEEDGNEYNDCKSFIMEINNNNTDRVLNDKTMLVQSPNSTFGNFDNGRIIGRHRSPLRLIGGLSIAIGSVFLIDNLDEEISGLETPEEYKDRTDETQKIGYTFILIGGLLIGFSK